MTQTDTKQTRVAIRVKSTLNDTDGDMFRNVYAEAADAFVGVCHAWRTAKRQNEANLSADCFIIP